MSKSLFFALLISLLPMSAGGQTSPRLDPEMRVDIVTPKSGADFDSKEIFSIVAKTSAPKSTQLRVQFFIDDHSIATDGDPPYYSRLSIPPNFAGRTLKIDVKAEDDSGRVAWAKPVFIKVSNTVEPDDGYYYDPH